MIRKLIPRAALWAVGESERRNFLSVGCAVVWCVPRGSRQPANVWAKALRSGALYRMDNRGFFD